MHKSRFKAPYNKAGKPTYSHAKIKAAAGVYLIKNKAGKLLYIGHSTKHLYKTMYRHFQSWNDKTQYRATYNKKGYSVMIVKTTAKQAPELEKSLILKHRPKDNKIKLDLFLTPIKQEKIITKYKESDYTPF